MNRIDEQRNLTLCFSLNSGNNHTVISFENSEVAHRMHCQFNEIGSMVTK